MREILFKAKPKDWREHPKDAGWVEGYYAMMGTDNLIKHYIVQNCAITRLFKNPEDNMYFNDVEIDPETLCQYTGLKDNNGKKIWENDIVLCKKYIGGNFVDYCIEYGYVEMKYGAFGIHRLNPDAYYRPFKDWLEDYEYEVIGNIFDNPELLKGDIE